MLLSDSFHAGSVGIARLAASADLLEAKRRVEYRELPTRRYITRCQSSRVPFEWTINPYRGCEYGCKYCYARYTHEFMDLRDPLEFETRIFAKEWDPDSFRNELRRIAPRHWIAIGTATDPYQPAERRCQITRRMLEVLAGAGGRRLSITTKSDLVVRDLDLLTRIASANVLHVAITITTMDEAVARQLEPYAPRPRLRMASVRRLAAAGLRVGVLACPVLPGLTDSAESIEAVASAASHVGASSLAGGLVFLKPCTHEVFFQFLEQHYPGLAPKYRARFSWSAFLKGGYPELIRARILRARQRHGLRERFADYRPEHWPREAQMELPFPGRESSFVEKSTC